MSQSSLPFGLTGPIIARSTACLFGLLGTTMGARALIQPLSFAETFGLPQPQSTRGAEQSTSSAQEPNPLIPVLGARTLAGGLTTLVFAYQKRDQALGLSLMLGCIVGITDGVVVSNRGLKDAGLGHFVTAGIFTSLGAYLYLLE